MTHSIQAILSPLFILSYIFGTRIAEFPMDKPRPKLGILYILLYWSAYYFLIVYTAIRYVYNNSTMYHLCLRLNIYTAILSTVLGLYYNKKFRNCLRKLSIVDNTLQELGITTDYQQLYIKIILSVFGWFTFVVWRTCVNGLWYTDDCGLMEAFYISFILDYCTFINFINDLIITNILGYIELKFDQVNAYLRKLEIDNEHKIRQTWNDLMLFSHPNAYSEFKNYEYVTWIVMYYKKRHLHLELRRISRELNLIFGLQMTIKMATYFAFISLGFREIFNVMLVKNYVSRVVLFIALVVVMLISNIFKLFLIHYMCERVSIKANTTGDLINKISYSSYTVIIRENISQLILQINQSPLRFSGLGLFKFGLKFLHGFTNSVITVIVILVQSHINK